MAEPPAPEEVWEEILLRLLPDDPASLVRASLVCKKWRRIVSRRAFLRRLTDLHRAAPMLGFFEITGGFVPTTSGSAFSLPATAPDRRTWRYCLDCRHGRVLFMNGSARDILVWEPITSYQRCVRLKKAWGFFKAAVVCAADGCDHWSCHGRPFRVVIIWSSRGNSSVTLAREYSSEADAWSEPTPIPVIPGSSRGFKATILVGNSLYFLNGLLEIVRYDLGVQGRVEVIQLVHPITSYSRGSSLMQAEDGGLGLAGVEGSSHSLHLWSRQTSGSADAEWVLRRTIHLKNLLPATALSEAKAYVVGFVEGANAIFIHTTDSIFAIEPELGRARKLRTSTSTSALLPFLSFYAPGIQADAGQRG